MAKAQRVKGIDCHGPASSGIKLVLTTRFGELYDLRETALDWSDPEGVHSMRVASRRLRSALRDFVPYLRQRGISSIQKQLKTLADALGDVRDQDVAIMALEKIRLPEKLSSPLKQFIETTKEIRGHAREELKTTLESGRLRQLETDFLAALDKATASSERKSAPTYLKMSRAIVMERLKELETLSAGLFSPFEVKTLHEMRIAAKRLRYALELFQPCWGRAFGSYAKRTARIQSTLGDLHDCDVWIESLGKQINVARKRKQHEDVEAFVWLLNHFVKLRTKHLRQALSKWSDWEQQDIGAKLRATDPQKSA